MVVDIIRRNKSFEESPMTKHSTRILQYFDKLKFDDSWSFQGLTQKDTNYITHGYHRYPAKFIPQLA
ncbi:MAG: hypothetical protein ABIL20_06315, partial [candidate division WOR-3 bacterium]